MSDIERQLREAMSAAVADAQPPSAVMELVRRRHRRRNTRVATAGVVVLAAVVAAVPVAGALLGGGRPAHRSTSAAALFPGGGRILFADPEGRQGPGSRLEWLYPDGRTVAIASGFTGATPQGTGLLAWKQTKYGFSYYTMNLDGSAPRLVLPAGHSKQQSDQEAQLSPDGSRLTYIREDVLPGGKVTEELWSADLATGRKTDLGPGFRSTLAWRDNATILAVAPNGRALQLVDTSDGSRTTYLTVSDPTLIRAYERARPGAGPPAFISSDGWSTGANPSALAVSLAARNSAGFFSKPAEILVEGGHTLAFAPDDRQQLVLTWGPRGMFLLQSGAGDNPLWNTYVGTTRDEHMQNLGYPGFDSGAVNPAGNVIALTVSSDAGGSVTFVPVPSPACHLAGRCLHFHPNRLSGRETLLAWVP